MNIVYYGMGWGSPAFPEVRKERGEGRFYHRGTEDTEGEEEGEKGERKGIERGGEKKRGKRKQGREFYHRGAESTEMEKGDQKLNLWQATGSDRNVACTGERKGIERGGEKRGGKRKQGREFYHRGAESTEMEKGDQKLNLWQATGSDRKRQECRLYRKAERD